MKGENIIFLVHSLLTPVDPFYEGPGREYFFDLFAFLFEIRRGGPLFLLEGSRIGRAAKEQGGHAADGGSHVVDG